VNYRTAVKNAITQWNSGGCFRSKSEQSQAAVDALEDLMDRSALDDDVAELVDWLVGVQLQRPRLYPLLTPIKAKCKLRDVLNAVVNNVGRTVDPPQLRAQIVVKKKPQSSVLVTPSPLPKPKKKKAVVKPTAVVQPTIKTPLLQSQSSSSSSSSQAVVVSQPVVSKTPVVLDMSRSLMNDCAYKSGGTLLFSYDQMKVEQMLRIPEGNFFGFCNAASGRFLQEPATFEKYLKSFKGKVDLVNAQARYESVGKADVYVTKTYGLTHVKTTGPHTLNAENVWTSVAHGAGTRMILYLVGASDGTGHAIGIVKTASEYLFLDVNEGLTSFSSGQQLRDFIGYYVSDKAKGLRNDYPLYCMGYWA
jgi:hypothetical protein